MRLLQSTPSYPPIIIPTNCLEKHCFELRYKVRADQIPTDHPASLFFDASLHEQYHITYERKKKTVHVDSFYPCSNALQMTLQSFLLTGIEKSFQLVLVNTLYRELEGNSISRLSQTTQPCRCCRLLADRIEDLCLARSSDARAWAGC